MRFVLVGLVWLVAAAGICSAESLEQLYARGDALGRAGKFSDAAPLIRQAAEGGYAQAQFALGSMYAFGDGVPQSKTEARLWYEKAAAQSHPVALYNLGLYYDKGIGVAQDRVRALGYYKRGADAGDGKAAFNAGQLLVTGDGVTPDVAEGVRLMERSAALDIPQAQISLGYVYSTGLGVPRNAQRALDYYARAEAKGFKVAAERGLSLASLVLEEGLALERDRRGREALRMLDLACRYGQFYACYNAGRMRLKGEIVAKDLNAAAASFRAACKWDNAPGCTGLGNAIVQGATGTADDFAKTVKLATTLCDQGNVRGCHNLAIMKVQPRYKIYDQPGAMKLLAQNCFNKGFQPSCQPYMDMYNASLPKSSGGGGSSGGMSWLEQGLLDVLGVVAGTMSAVGSAGQYSAGSYAGYSTTSSTGASSGGYSPQDRADFNQFISSVSAYGQHVQCRAGNPYC
jgi:TPR repeat protein